MNTLKTIAACVTTGAVITLGLGWLYIERSTPAVPVPASTTAPQVCEEDMTCWDCATMGNGICGHPPMDHGLPVADESPVVLR